MLRRTLVSAAAAGYETLASYGVARAGRPLRTVVVSAAAGGAMLGAAGALVVAVVGSAPEAAARCPPCARVAAGAIFPVGLSMIVLSGSDLLTSAFAVNVLPFRSPATAAAAAAALRPRRVATLWAAVAAGNVAGSAAAAAAAAAVFPRGSAPAAWAAAAAKKKCALSLGEAFCRGVAANALVNVAVLAAASQSRPAAKVAALWLPIGAFIALGFEHSVANLFLLPLGAMSGANVGAADIAHNLLPVTLGNFVGAMLVVAFYRPAAAAAAASAALRAAAKRTR
jgi:formate/nitrite transporter